MQPNADDMILFTAFYHHLMDLIELSPAHSAAQRLFWQCQRLMLSVS